MSDEKKKWPADVEVALLAYERAQMSGKAPSECMSEALKAARELESARHEKGIFQRAYGRVN